METLDPEDTMMTSEGGERDMKEIGKTGIQRGFTIFDSVTPFQILMVEDLSDVILVVGSHIIAVHKIILASHSTFLADILGDKHPDGGTTEENIQVEKSHVLDKACLVLTDFSLEAVTKMVHFIYSGELISDRAGLPEVQDLARQLSLVGLEQQVGELSGRLKEDAGWVETITRSEAADINEVTEVAEVAEVGDALEVGEVNEVGFCLIQEDSSSLVVVEEGGEGEDSFITLSGLEQLGEGEVVLGQEGEQVVTHQERDLQTPVQSPEPLVEEARQGDVLDTGNGNCTEGEYFQCDQCHISCTDLDYLKRHKKAKHSEDIFQSLEGLIFNCSLCSHSTDSKQGLVEHVRCEHPSKEFQCDTCSKHFVSLSKLEEHMTTHSGDRSYSCQTCGKAFSRPYHLKVHTRIHTGEKPYKCAQCERTFVDSSALRGHMKTHSEEKPFQCPTCNRQFKDKGNLKQHESTHKEERPYRCAACGQGFVFKRNMIRHSESQACSKDLKNKGNSVEFPRQDEKNLDSESSSSILDLVTNEGMNEAESHSCPECGVKFFNVKTLRHHRKTSHSALGTFKCTLCSKSWKNECDLKNHMKEHTDKKKRYVCSYCSKAWDRPSDLEKHLRVHTGDKPFHCKVCHKKFGDRSLFLKHSRTHGGSETTQVFVCGICDKKFQVEANLEKHLKVHTAASYACSSCGKKFYDELSLQAHINLHNGATPYNCSFCGKDFTHMADLKKHERVHTGEKPHKCDHCDKTFADLSAVRKHERRHTKISAPQHFLCLGCNKNFLKEEAFFKHATLQRSKRCPGRPSMVPGTFPLDSIVRCLQCKLTLTDPEDLRCHLDNPQCQGPIYAKVALESSSSQDQIKVITMTDVEEEQGEVVETLTTIVEIEDEKTEENKVKCEYEEDEEEKENTVMRALTQLSQLMGEIGEPKQDLPPLTHLFRKENIENQ